MLNDRYCKVELIPALGQRIAIFGGSFDPVHNAHIEIAKLAKESLKLDAVLFVPANQNPLKANAPLASNQARLEMLSLALKEMDKLYVTDFEYKVDSVPSYSIDTVRAIQASYGINAKMLYFIFGADQISRLHLWKDYKELFKLVKFIVFGRSGIEPAGFANLNPNLNQQEIAALQENYLEFYMPISSTELRAKLKTQDLEKLSQHIPENVLEYIVAEKLYC